MSTHRGGRTGLFEAHLDRLEESARLEGIPVMFNRERIRAGLRELLDRSDSPRARVRVTVTGASSYEVILALEPWSGVDPWLKEEGVHAATARIERENPRAKGNTWEHRRLEAMNKLSEDVYEGLLVDEEDWITEGFTSNFHAMRDGRIHTAAEGVLLGISRPTLPSNLPGDVSLDETPVSREGLNTLAEWFLTSISRSGIPIVKIDEHTIGSGRPGETTRRLAQRYDVWVSDHLEPI